jgi:opacity protein-like surface antigen
MIVNKCSTKIIILAISSIMTHTAISSTQQPKNPSYYKKRGYGYLKKQHQAVDDAQASARNNEPPVKKHKIPVIQESESSYYEQYGYGYLKEQHQKVDNAQAPAHDNQFPAKQEIPIPEKSTDMDSLCAPEPSSIPCASESAIQLDQFQMKALESALPPYTPEKKPAYKSSRTDSGYTWKPEKETSRPRIRGSTYKTYTYTSAYTGSRYEAKIRGAAFIPSSDAFRDIYGTVMGNVDAEFAVQVHKYLQVWANFDYTQTWGNALGSCDIASPNFCSTTHIRIINGSAGLKAPFDINDWFRVYLGVGPTFGGIHIKGATIFTGDYSCSDSTSSIGFVAKSGMNFFFGKKDLYYRSRWLVDIFADYVYQKAEFQKDVNASGLRVGAGIGIRF